MVNFKLDEIYNEDCLETLKRIPDNYLDLVITSPPYAEQRKSTYGGIKTEFYVEWFSHIAEEIYRTLKPTGSFFLNIKNHVENGQRSVYTLELVIHLNKVLGFNYIEEYTWIKNAYPGKYKGRFKNGFEPVYHFSKGDNKQIKFLPYACATLKKEESIKRAYRKQLGSTSNGSGMGGVKYREEYKTQMLALPSNVLKINNTSNQYTFYKKDHPATYPVELVDFFVKSFTTEGDVVYDPFMGSGTTACSCINNNRSYIGSEINENYYKMCKERLQEIKNNKLF